MSKSKQLLSILSICMGLAFSTLNTANAIAGTLPIAVEGQSVPSLAPMLDKVLPAVVSVHVEGTQVRRQFIPDEFRFFFGPNFPGGNESSQPFEGLGSGVIINAEKGYVVTNNHVIENADKIKVQINDGREFEAKLIGRDPQSDIALLQIENAKNLVALHMSDSDKLRIGDFAVAIGNPFGLGQTATSGIISALGRSGLNMNGLENFIQTDASINRGNSGGALVNLNGQLIGINTAIIAPGGGNVGIGFAIPSNMVKDLTSQLIRYGEVKRGVLGIRGNEVTSDIAEAFDSNVQRGAFVSEVMAKSAAELAGIKSGDIIVSIDNKPIHSFAELRAKIATMGAGRKVKLGLIRDGKSLNVEAELQKSDDTTTNAKSLLPVLEGASLSNVTDSRQPGIKVDDIVKGSPAERAGLQKDDLIVGANRQPIQNIADLRKIIDSKPPVIALNIKRGESSLYLILR